MTGNKGQTKLVKVDNLSAPQTLEGEWTGFDNIEQFSLDDIAKAHEFVEGPSQLGRVVLKI